MGCTVLRVDKHLEKIGKVLRHVEHVFESHPRASQALLEVDGEPVLRVGDEFENESVLGHVRPNEGSFVAHPSGRGAFVRAGQELVRLNGVSLQVLAGTLRTCCEVEPLVPCTSAVRTPEPTRFRISGSPVLPANPKESPR